MNICMFQVCISTVEFFPGKQLGAFENGTEEQLTLEEKSEEPTKYLQKIQKKGKEIYILLFVYCQLQWYISTFTQVLVLNLPLNISTPLHFGDKYFIVYSTTFI